MCIRDSDYSYVLSRRNSVNLGPRERPINDLKEIDNSLAGRKKSMHEFGLEKYGSKDLS